MAVAVAFNSVLRELRSYDQIQPLEAAKFGELVKEQFYWEDGSSKQWLLAQDLAAMATRDIRDVLKYLHKFVSESPGPKACGAAHLTSLTILELCLFLMQPFHCGIL